MGSPKVSEEIMSYVKNEIEKTEFGEVVIELSGNKKSVDVITTNRKRFEKGEEESGGGVKIMHQG